MQPTVTTKNLNKRKQRKEVAQRATTSDMKKVRKVAERYGRVRMSLWTRDARPDL
jgi:hypothetical protein